MGTLLGASWTRSARPGKASVKNTSGLTNPARHPGSIARMERSGKTGFLFNDLAPIGRQQVFRQAVARANWTPARPQTTASGYTSLRAAASATAHGRYHRVRLGGFGTGATSPPGVLK